MTAPARPAPAPDPIASVGASERSLRLLELAIDRKLDGLIHGDHESTSLGAGTEGGECRLYQPGDDVRRIDWNVTARLQDPYVRDTIADRELETWVVADLGASMDFGTAWCEKRDLAISAAAAIGFLTNRTGNRFGMVTLQPSGTTVTPARGGRTHLMSTLHRLTALPRAGQGEVDLGAALARTAAIARRRGLAVVVSDFLAPPESWEQQLRRLSTRHETIAVEVLDPRELALPDVGVLSLVDPATGATREVPTASKKLRARYEAAASAQREAISVAIRRAGVDHLVLRTDQDWLLDIVRFVASRRERVHARRAGWEAR